MLHSVIKTSAKLAVLATFISSCAMSAQAADTYKFDPMHTSITWHANHFGFSNPSGKFTGIDGKVTLDEAAPQNSSVNVTIHTGSLVTGLDKFDTHIKSKDFLNVQKFPDATFVSTKVTPTGQNTAKVEGNLTLVGITKPITLNVTLNKLGDHPMQKVKSAGFTATTVLKRSEFGIVYATPAVSDDVKIDIEAEANLVK